MTVTELASAYLSRARLVFAEAKAARVDETHDLAVRRAQEVVELALKALLRACGLEVPRVHDVKEVLLRHRERLPEPARSRVEDMAAVSARLGRQRGPAFYGDEEAGLPPSSLFTREDGDVAVDDASWILAACEAAVVSLGV